jgi:hypothetical protein
LNQKIARPVVGSAEDLVSHLGAVQAQDYNNALWAIGLRTAGATEAAIEQAVAERKIVRTWPMRGTLHFVAADDVRWILELLTPRVLSAAMGRAEHLGLDERTLDRCRAACIEALGGGRQLTREALLARIAAAGIPVDAHRGYHMLWRLAQQGVICFGPREGKLPTFVLLDEWLPRTKRLDRSAALAELARRYFTSHGPATVQDFVWWSGLKVSEAKEGIDGTGLTREAIDGVTYWSPAERAQPVREVAAAHLLPAFDEYLLGYRDRSAVLDPRHAGRVVPGSNGIFLPILVVHGRVVGTWKRVVKSERVIVHASPFDRLPKAVNRAIAGAAEVYASFVGKRLEVKWTETL